MTLPELKDRHVKRLSGLEQELRAKRETVAIIEADLVQARREAAIVDGAVQQLRLDIGEVELAINAAEMATKQQKAPKPPGA